MSMIDIGMFIPLCKGPGTSSTVQLNGADERYGACGYFITPDGLTRSITHICWATTTVVTGDDILCQIESIDSATGLPNGIIATGASGTQTVANTDDYVFFETALTTPYTLTNGSWLACTFKMLNAGKDVSLYKGYAYGTSGQVGHWTVEDITGAGVFVNTAYKPNIALKTSDGEYLIVTGGTLVKRSNITNINTETNPRYVGNKIQFDRQVKLSGAYLSYIDMDYNMTVKLMDASGNTIIGDDGTSNMELAIKAVYRYGTSVLTNSPILFKNSKTLLAMTPYYLVLSPDTANSVPVFWYSYQTKAIKKQDLGIPSWMECNYVLSPSTISFTEVDTQIASISPILSEIAIPTGGSYSFGG